MKDRSSGILLHISSLPGKFGIGDFGEEAYKFVDFLWDAKQKNWQILPLGITSFGDSPYQSFSAFAGNPYFIDINELINSGYIKENELDTLFFGNNPIKVDYGLLYRNKMYILKKSYKEAKHTIYNDLKYFYEENYDWIRDFALFMTIKGKHNNKSWLEWDKKYQEYNSPDVLQFERENNEEIFFWVFTQYLFSKQWKRLKEYANNKGISIIGDLPIYIAIDSADVWSNPKLFNLDDSFRPITVSGCPPDAFSAKGQLWGNPIYKWDVMEKEDYKWWIKRIEYSFKLFDTLRIDHFIGFESFWEVQYGDEDATRGRWSKGPGIKLFNKIKEELGELDIIVEDLGVISDAVRELVKNTGFPSMKVIQFAFDKTNESEHMPHLYNKNMVVYTGTHDNLPIMSWFENVSKDELNYAIEYLKLNHDEGLNWGMIRGIWSSCANLAIAPMQDFLALGETSRMNLPSTIGENWTWRLKKEDLTESLSKKIRDLTEIYWR
ncbi:4-alpha-glucanotransferase [Tissierella creatinophila]|uniref:4-alpha-glucanotransferase n=1 Tax=Tissierella creatinophila DSM 6911 TaxID=1123403 RepID=A0A1U7M6U2_TISCR|nr:4-alpha-glucanotransferase [Tissierella creatinophila]OLS02929.1 4-alpha-glucanotransferase [Tissierella creatinophila DSM 6911]